MSQRPPIFVISLPEATDRRAAMAAQMERLGLEFAFIDAVDGRGFNMMERSDYDARKRLAFFGLHLKGGEWGCLLSHKNIYEIIVAHNLDQAIIFEDDALIDPHFPTILDDLLSMDLDYDVIRFMGSNKIARKGYRQIIEVDKNLWLGRLPSIHGGAHAYLMSREGAQKMVDYFARHQVAYPIDTLLGRCWETGLNVYAINPIVRQDTRSFVSSIGEARENKRGDLQGMQKLVFPAFRAWHKLCEQGGKRWIYARSFWQDKTLREKYRGAA